MPTRREAAQTAIAAERPILASPSYAKPPFTQILRDVRQEKPSIPQSKAGYAFPPKVT